jgi:23S rRNA pseudouridine2605 synthase
MEAAIVAGKVLVNGRRATVGQRVGPSDRLSFDGRPVALKIERRLPRVLAYHKPPGELVTARDPQGRPTV